MKTIFENNGGTYTQVGDYLLPNLSLTAEEKETNIGVWAMRHKRYLKQNHKVRYCNLLTSGKLDSYLKNRHAHRGKNYRKHQNKPDREKPEAYFSIQNTHNFSLRLRSKCRARAA